LARWYSLQGSKNGRKWDKVKHTKIKESLSRRLKRSENKSRESRVILYGETHPGIPVSQRNWKIS